MGGGTAWTKRPPPYPPPNITLASRLSFEAALYRPWYTSYRCCCCFWWWCCCCCCYGCTTHPLLSLTAPRPLLDVDPRSQHPQVVGYLKLAHLVPFSVLLDVTKMAPDAVMLALSAEGRQRGLLVRGNWAARAPDVWPRGPPHAANCLSVAQCLLHK